MIYHTTKYIQQLHIHSDIKTHKKITLTHITTHITDRAPVFHNNTSEQAALSKTQYKTQAQIILNSLKISDMIDTWKDSL